MKENKESLKQDFKRRNKELKERLESLHIMLKLRLRIKEELRKPRDSELKLRLEWNKSVHKFKLEWLKSKLRERFR